MERTEFFTLADEDGIFVLTMQAPGNNLMTDVFFEEFEKIIQKIKAVSDSAKGLIIRGGGRHFSVGANVESLAKHSSSELFNMKDEYDFPEGHIFRKNCFLLLNELDIPVVSAVSGFCIGSGSEIAVNSHFRICEKNARVGQPESSFGILPTLGGTARTAEICGLAIACEMVLSGELLSAEQAYKIGWADMVVEKKQSLSAATALIELISARMPYDRTKTDSYLSDFISEKGNLYI